MQRPETLCKTWVCGWTKTGGVRGGATYRDVARKVRHRAHRPLLKKCANAHGGTSPCNRNIYLAPRTLHDEEYG